MFVSCHQPPSGEEKKKPPTPENQKQYLRRATNQPCTTSAVPLSMEKSKDIFVLTSVCWHCIIFIFFLCVYVCVDFLTLVAVKYLQSD